MNTFDVELTADDVLDVTTGQPTKSKLRRERTPEGDLYVYDKDEFGNEFLRMHQWTYEDETTTECFDEHGALHDWGSRPAIVVKHSKTGQFINKEHYSHGQFVHIRMAVPLKSELDDCV